MLDFLSKIDPNVIVALVGAVLTALKIHRDNHGKEGIGSMLENTLRQVVIRLVDVPDARDKARALLNQAADEVLSRIGVKRASVTLLVHGAIEAGLAELEDRLADRQADAVSLQAATDLLAKSAKPLSDGSAFDEAERRGRARMTFDDEQTSPRAEPPELGHDDERGAPDPSPTAEASAVRVRAAIRIPPKE